jgi:hypothetical protein
MFHSYEWEKKKKPGSVDSAAKNEIANSEAWAPSQKPQ